MSIIWPTTFTIAIASCIIKKQLASKQQIGKLELLQLLCLSKFVMLDYNEHLIRVTAPVFKLFNYNTSVEKHFVQIVQA